MKYPFLHASIWIILLTIVIIIFENKINCIHAQPVKKIVSWYSQIHSKENPLEIFIQDEDKEVIASTTLNYKDIRHSNAYNSETLGNNASLLKPSEGENEEQKFFESDTSLNFLQPEAMLDENSLKRDTGMQKIQGNGDAINSQSRFSSIINSTVPTNTHDIKKTRRTKIAKKVKRLKTDNTTVEAVNMSITLKYNQSLIVTVSPFNNISSNISLFKKRLLLKPYSSYLAQPSLKPNVNIRDPNIIKSLKSMDLSLLSFPPAFMYGNAIRNERKGSVNKKHEVKKRFVPGQMRSYDIENHFSGESSINNNYNNSYQQVLKPHLNMSEYTGIQLNDVRNTPTNDNILSKVQLPFSSENDSCNMFESLPIILIKPDGEIVKVDTVNNVVDNVQTRSTGKANEQIGPNLGGIVNSVTVIPVHIDHRITEGVDKFKLIKEGTNIYHNSSETVEGVPPHRYILSNITNEKMNMNYEIPILQDVNRYNVSFNNATFFNKTEDSQYKINERANIGKKLDISKIDTVFKINQLANMDKINKESKKIPNRNNSSYWDRFLVNVGGEKFMQSELSQMQTYLNNSETNLHKDMSNEIYDRNNVDNNNVSSNNNTNNPKDLDIINNLMHEILSNKMFTNINVPERYNFKVFTTDNRNGNGKQCGDDRATCRTQCPMFVNPKNCSHNWGPFHVTTRSSFRPNENECRQTTNSEAHIKILGFILEDDCNRTSVKPTCQETHQTICNPNWKLLDYGKKNYLTATNYNSSKPYQNVYWNNNGYNNGFNMFNRSCKHPTTGNNEFPTRMDKLEQTEVTRRAYHFTTSSSYYNMVNHFTSSSYNNMINHITSSSNKNFIRQQPDMSVKSFVSLNPTSQLNYDDTTEEMNMQDVKQFLRLIKSALDRKMARQAEKERPEIEVRSNLAKDNIYYKGMNDLLLY